MARTVTIAPGTGRIVLPNGKEYTDGDMAVLSDEQFDRLDPDVLGVLVTLDGDDLGSISERLAALEAGGGSGTSGLLAAATHDPTSQVVYNTATQALTALDTTNLRVTFTVPSSGRVLIRLSAAAERSGANLESVWGVLAGATTVVDDMSTSRSATPDPVSRAVVVGGLTPDDELTWDWAQRQVTGSGGTSTTYAGGNAGPATMEVWSA